MSPRRYLALHLPRLATDRLERAEPVLRGRPLALWARHGSRRALAAVNAAAAEAKLSPGLALADAIAICPGLVAREAAPAADALLLVRLARWAGRYTPLAAPAGCDGLVLDIFGCAPLFGGEAGLLQDAAARLRQLGFAAAAAIAANATAALALARAGRHGAILGAGEELSALARLPLSTLGLAPDLRARLAAFGIADIGSLARLPRAGLARRAGGAVLALLDQALGGAAVPIRPLAPPPAFTAALDFAEPIATAAAIAAALVRLLEDLCARLARAGCGARRLSLACHRLDGEVQRLGIATSLAVRDPCHLMRLFRDRLERIAPGFGIERMVLGADVVERTGAAQLGLVAGPGPGDAGAAELGALVDRLCSRLGAGAVCRLALHASHIPERAMTPAGPLPLPAPEQAAAKDFPPRPVRLFDPPEPVGVLALLPDGPPQRLCWRRRVVGIARAEGPERIAPEWWREPGGVARDYWRVEAEGGGRLWLYRTDPAAWFLHGLFG